MTGRVGRVKGYYVFYIACVRGVGWYMYMYTVGEAGALYTVIVLQYVYACNVHCEARIRKLL